MATSATPALAAGAGHTPPRGAASRSIMSHTRHHRRDAPDGTARVDQFPRPAVVGGRGRRAATSASREARAAARRESVDGAARAHRRRGAVIRKPRSENHMMDI